MTAVPGGDEVEVPFPPARLAVGVVWGEIDAVDDLELPGEPVDAIAVGHYLGVTPAGAERALDEAVSRCMLGRKDERLGDDELVITQLAQRGTVRGDLGQPFLLPDPRVGGERGRLLAIAGMGLPGRFGEPELAVVARELCWALGRLRRRHLATVLIGAGAGNLTVTSAVAAWIRGAKLAVTGAEEDGGAQLRRITFVERDPRRLAEIRATILAHRRELNRRNRLKLTYHGVTGKELAGEEFREATRAFERKAWEEWQRAQSDEREPAPTRVSLELEGGTYRFGALTPSASVPLREVELDPALVLRANDELVAERDPHVQLERAQFLEKLLIPADLRPSFYTAAPLVMMLDSTTARISWEVLARAEAPVALAEEGATDAAPDEEVELERWYLGTSRGFTRQLRTAFAPPPEPPPPARRLLSVLIVADPAEDEPLAGAQEEGRRVAELFRQFNTVWADSESRVRVVALIGPQEATRTAVLRHLLLRTYDVLHFAGHCTYDPERPLDCGWVFTGGEKLSVRELNRVDRIPRFVFANACESGITPDRSGERHDRLAPSFAEAFFARGVSNFVCTAWPVDDGAASEFALTLYSSLLGVDRPEPGASAYGSRPARVMHEAMREARVAIARWPAGTRTWGAYQHYGDPFFRFFELSHMRGRDQQS